MSVVIDGTTGISGTNGSAGTPAVQGEDTNTGIFFPAADTVAVATAGTERLRVDSAGNLGLGVTPSAWGGTFKSLDVGAYASLWNTSGGTIGVAYNAYHNGTNFIYKASSIAPANYQQSLGAHQWYIAPSGTAGNSISFTQAMTLDSSGNLLVGTTTAQSSSANRGNITVGGAAGSIVNWASASSRLGYIFHDGTNMQINNNTGGYLNFYTSDTERARIDSSGIFSVGCTALSTTSTTDTGAQLGSSGAANFFRSGGAPLIVMRQTNDGTLIDLRQGGTQEGQIVVSGTTVSYQGGHLARWAQFPDNSRPELLKGTVMSNLDQMSQWGEEDNEQLNCVQVSTVEGDPDVAGVFVAWDSTDDGYNDILLAMTGDMVIRIGAGVTVARGDLLMSAGDGTAKPQGDDIVRSKTIAKVTSTHVSHTYADGSYAVPCVLMAC